MKERFLPSEASVLFFIPFIKTAFRIGSCDISADSRPEGRFLFSQLLPPQSNPLLQSVPDDRADAVGHAKESRVVGMHAVYCHFGLMLAA